VKFSIALIAAGAGPAGATSTRIEPEHSNLEEILRVVRHRWWIIALCTLIAGGAAVGFSLTQRKQYTASASLLFQNPGFDQIIFGTSLFSSETDPTRQAATNIDLVSLPELAARTSKALGGHPTQRQLSAEIQVSAVGQADVAGVAATDPSPSRAAEIANSYAQQYILFRQEADRAKIAGAQRQVRQQLASMTPRQRNGSVGQSLLNRANQLRILASLQTGDAELVQPATVPHSPSSPKTTRNGVLGALLGLMLGCVLAFLVERLDRRLRAAPTVEEAYGAPILAAVQHSPAYEANPTVEVLPAAVTETFGLLRARLRYFNVDRDLRSLLITSASMGEGKSTIALHLAIAGAMAGGSSVVLVEADLRRPSLARKVGARTSPGLAEAISSNVTFDEALQEVVVPGRSNGSAPAARFHLIAGGAVPPNPAELVESQSMRQLLSALVERFDLVIIDSPPAAVVSDAIPLVSQVSGLVVVCRVGMTTRDAAKHLRGELLKLNAPTLGVVANDVQTKGRGYYGYSYGYGYSGGYESNGAWTESRASTHEGAALVAVAAARRTEAGVQSAGASEESRQE
jgi:polysaccharide biosynthesis transport protein